MARIPIYDAPRVQERGLPNAFQQGTNNVRAFTGGGEQLAELGQGIQRAGAQFDQIADRLQVAEVNKTDAAITSGWLKWEAENRPKFVGENAANFQAEADKWWQETKNTYRQNVNPVTLERLNQTLGQRYDRAMAGVISYQADQVNRHTISTANSRINSDVEWGVATGDTETAAVRVRSTSEELAILNRWSPEQKDEFVRGKLDAMHGARVIALVRDDATAAATYLDQAIAQGELSAVRSAQLRETVKAASEEQEGQRLARSVADLPYAERLKAASEQENPGVRKAMEATIEADQRALERIKKEQVSSMVGNLQTSMYSTGRVPSAADLERVRQVDPEAAGSLAKEIAAFRKARREEAEGRAVKTNFELLGQLYNMPNDEFAQVNLNEFQDQLSDADKRTLIKRQADIRNPEKLPEVTTATQQVNNHPFVKTLKNERLGQFLTAYGQDVNSFIQVNKREPTYAEREEILDGLTMKVRGGWFSTTRGFQVEPEERAAARAPAPAAAPPAAAAAPLGGVPTRPAVSTIRVIPGDVRREITQALRDAGQTVSEDNIQRVYATMTGAQ